MSRTPRRACRIATLLLLFAAARAFAAPNPCSSLRPAHAIVLAGKLAALDLQTRMDVDVDGAPNAYGPPGKAALDIDKHAHGLPGTAYAGQVVGYILQYPGGPPRLQGPRDPYPGYYISQTTFEDESNPNQNDPRRYVDASRINYVVLGRDARRAGVRIGDFASVYSCRTGRSAWAIVADSGNESGAEGSLALVRNLGYTWITNGIDESVNRPEIVIRYYPRSNPSKLFFRTQAALDRAAHGLHLPTLFEYKRP